MRISDWSSDLCSSDLRSFILVTLALLDSQLLGLRTLFDLGGDARLAAVMDARARRFQRLLEIGDRGFLAATGILELAHAQREDFRTQLALLGCCEVIARGFLRFVRVADVGNAGRFPARDDMITPRARICQMG